MRITRRVRRPAVAALVVGIALGAGGCGSASAPSPPSGVDGLVIPTPSPDPADFVAKVDNPWLPLAPYSRWEYDVTDGGATGSSREAVSTTVVTVENGPDIAGVATVAVHTTPQERLSAGLASVDYYAQDRAGNVWWFGREGEWRAGEGGVGAGLAMPARPRFGDGFRMSAAIDTRAEVAGVEERTEVPAGSFEDLVLLEVTVGDIARKEYYAKGVGLVATEVVGQETTTGLVVYDEPR